MPTPNASHNMMVPIKQQGFTLLETVLALIVFAMMGLVFSAVVPASMRTARINGHYAQAAALAQHKIAQVRAAGFSSLQSPASMAALGIIDSGSATSASVPYTASFAASDHLLAGSNGIGIFPQGTTATITVADYAATYASVPAGTVDTVKVTILWPVGTTTSGSCSMSGLVIQMPHS